MNKSFTATIVVADFNSHVTAKLLEGAKGYLQQQGLSQENVTVLHVPGCYEIPLVAKKLAETKKYDFLVCLGCVIRGETPHFDHVCEAASRGIAQASLETGVPMGFGVVMAENADQAFERAGGRHGHRGEEAARAALSVAQLLRGIS